MSFADVIQAEVRRLDDAERASIRRVAQEDAMHALGAMVTAMGGEIRVPAIARLERYTVTMREDSLTGEIIYTARLA